MQTFEEADSNLLEEKNVYSEIKKRSLFE